ncbi:MAG: ThiF family adenylyltransferase [Rhodocyclaceae bacterium]|nr:ThiF family adenylyltransferase [Rhodocyclaceae bacterium]
MTERFDYATFVSRNSGYVTSATLEKIRRTRLMIAGCGIGSSVAVAAARFGFENFLLVDGDSVELHNLNRQFYDFADVGKPKVEALKGQILRINPQARVEARQEFLGEHNGALLVKNVDIIFDTVDFLDLPAILALHTAAGRQQKTILTALSIGYGAGVCFFPAGCGMTLADLIAHDLAAAQAAGNEIPSYAQVFARVIGRIGRHLDAQVVEQIGRALTIMEDGRPCPASQVAPGSFTLGAMAVSLIHDFLDGREIPTAPKMVIHSFRKHQTSFVDLAAD